MSVTAFPVLNLNGTSYEELFRQVADACASCRHVLSILSFATPNSRDYHGRGPNYYQAVREHEERVAKIRSVLEELQKIAENLNDQQDILEVRR